MREQIWVGVDVGEAEHYACAVDESGKVIFSQRLRNDHAAIEALITRASTAGATVQWAVDMTSGTAALLLALLHRHGGSVQYVPGKLVNRMSGAFAGQGKTDAKDARTIAETVRLRADLSTITPPEALIVQLQVVGDLAGPEFGSLRDSPLGICSHGTTYDTIRLSGTDRRPCGLPPRLGLSPSVQVTGSSCLRDRTGRPSGR